MKIVLFLFLSLSLFAQDKPVKGVWLTNVDSKVLNSKDNIKEAVSLCHEVGINTIFVVVWNKGFTLYPSKIMEEFTGAAIIPDFAGRDPLKELIEEAHSKNIKVIAWFEFGFASSFRLNGGILLKLKPEWSSKNKDGNLVEKNGFEWMNGFNPEVQNFLLSLIKEVINNYDVDGIQGDDRLPAMPSTAGYDEYTSNLYKEKYNSNPPENEKDSIWIQFRADLLTDFMGRMAKEIRCINKDLSIFMSPSVYPWAKEEYLQDWPVWMEKGYVDLVAPQLYRYSFDKYKIVLEDIVKNQIKKQDLNKLYPGILLKIGKYTPDKEFLIDMLKENRKNGIKGEVFFFYEGIKEHKETIKNFYAEE